MYSGNLSSIHIFANRLPVRNTVPDFLLLHCFHDSIPNGIFFISKLPEGCACQMILFHHIQFFSDGFLILHPDFVGFSIILILCVILSTVFQPFQVDAVCCHAAVHFAHTYRFTSDTVNSSGTRHKHLSVLRKISVNFGNRWRD